MLNGSPIPSTMANSPRPGDLLNVEGKRILCTADIRGKQTKT
jgi:hypothetical protein